MTATPICKLNCCFCRVTTHLSSRSILATPPSVADRNQYLLGNGPHMSTVLDWLKQLGRAAARAGRPVERIEVFTVEGHNIRYQCVVLPFSRDQRNVDLLLCHLRAESTG